MPPNNPTREAGSHSAISIDEDTHILIAEDNQLSGHLIQKTLNRTGYKHIHQVTSGMDAINYLRERKECPLTIYITDIAMPGEIDGIEAARIIDHDYSLPVIFVTGFSDNETINRAKDIQPAAYLIKPYKTEEVIVAVEMAIHKAKIQQELSKTERHNHLLASALQSTQDAIMIVNTLADGPYIEFVNQAFCQLFDYTTDNQSRARIEDALGIRTAHQWIQHIRQLITKQSSEEWECKIDQSEHKKLLRVSASMIQHSQRNTENIVLVIRDITAIRLAEERQQHSQKIEAIGRFTGGIAHDFNNLLAVINSYSDLIKLKMGDDNPYLKYIDNIRSAGQRGTDLVAQLMTFTRSQPTSPRTMNLCETTESTFIMLRRIVRENINLQIHYTDDPLLIKASPSQIEQVLVNLCVNARDAIESEGEIKITLSRKTNKTSSNTKKLACLTIEDNGAGMPKDTLDKIFEPFFTTKDVGKGTGLGLSTVYGIVKKNNGTIEVHSEEGRGTTFFINFPEVQQEECEEPYAQIRDKAARKNDKGRETILVVEDDATIAESITGILAAHGYSILHYSDAEAALENHLHKAQDIDLLITDMLLPKLSGAELARQLSEMNPELKTLYITGDADTRQNYDYDPQREDMLQKPFRMSELLQTCKSMLIRNIK